MKKLLITIFILLVFYGCDDNPLRPKIEIFNKDANGERIYPPECTFHVWIWQIDDVEEIANERCYRE
jgi:hypothetical protein